MLWMKCSFREGTNGGGHAVVAARRESKAEKKAVVMRYDTDVVVGTCRGNIALSCGGPCDCLRCCRPLSDPVMLARAGSGSRTLYVSSEPQLYHRPHAAVRREAAATHSQPQTLSANFGDRRRLIGAHEK